MSRTIAGRMCTSMRGERRRVRAAPTPSPAPSSRFPALPLYLAFAALVGVILAVMWIL